MGNWVLDSCRIRVRVRVSNGGIVKILGIFGIV